jgi:hypothetical protein
MDPISIDFRLDEASDLRRTLCLAWLRQVEGHSHFHKIHRLGRGHAS